MKRVVAVLIVSALCFALFGCADRRVIYERKTPVYLETPAPETAKPWEINVTEAPTVYETADPEATPEPPFKFSGYAYCIINGTTGQVLLGEEENTRNYIASVTKILTALTALDWLKMNERVTVQKGWLEWLFADGSIDCYGIREGQAYLVSDLINMALVRSFGDAAVVLQMAAEARSGRNFLDLMNEKAWLFGMRDSHFDNVIGLDIGNNFTENYSTAEDAAKLMAEALKNEAVMNACSGKDIKLSTGGVLNNTSAFLTQKNPDAPYTVLGGKTGYTKAAGSNLAVAVRNNATGTVYVVAYLHGLGMNVLGGEINDMLVYLCENETELTGRPE